jgi:hypothetical protein
VSGKKKTLTKQQASGVDLKKYAELTSIFALQCCKDDPESMKYVPDHWLKPKAKACRNYLWTVLATIRGDFVN